MSARILRVVSVYALLTVVAAVEAQTTPAQSASVSSSSAASAVIDSLHRVLIANLVDGEAAGFDVRLARLTPVVASSFDFPAIARIAMGRTIESLDAATRRRFERLLEDLSAATYADGFAANDSEAQFVFVSEQPTRGGRFLVRTRLQRPREAAVAFDYVLQETDKGPRIVNVLADGVSDLSLKRAQYAAVIRADGVDSLLEQLEEQLLQLKEARSSD